MKINKTHKLPEPSQHLYNKVYASIPYTNVEIKNDDLGFLWLTGGALMGAVAVPVYMITTIAMQSGFSSVMEIFKMGMGL
ncbi:MAG: hypothetical protein ACPG8V_04155 [Alphaproteobacteria bacterium]